jgi:hypothetical protein
MWLFRHPPETRASNKSGGHTSLKVSAEVGNQADLRAARQRANRLIQIIYAALALLMAGLAAAVGIAAEPLGLSQHNRDIIAAGFLAAALLETTGLFLWDRIFPTSGGSRD